MRSITACLALALAGLYPPAIRGADVYVWQTVEITLQAEQPHADPWAGVQVWADLAGPEFSRRCYGFWDGGNTYRVRLQAASPGRWQWRSGSEPEDPGLSGRSGFFDASPWTDKDKRANPNRRGQIRAAAGGRYFEYADGTPYFLLACTVWAANTARCGLGQQQDGPFFECLADLRGKGFTCILVQAIHGYGDYPDGQAHRNEGGYAFLDRDPARLNPAYFHALDRRMQAISDQGLVAAVPTMWWGKTRQPLFTPQDARRISAYCAARYGTLNSLWSLAGEYQYTFADCGWQPADFESLGTAVQARNPWGHPLSIHPSGSTHWAPPHNSQSSRPFHGQAWLDHHWLQTGQSTDRMFRIATRVAENRALEPALPVFCSESFYERASDPDSAYHARWQVWAAFLSGAAGYGYGSFGLWQFLDPADPQGEPGKFVTGSVPWREALRLPGAAQVGHARTLLTSLDWWNLEPCPTALAVDGQANRLPTATDLRPPHAARIGSTWLVYLPRGNQHRRITLEPARPGRVTAHWFDPRTGQLLDSATTLDPAAPTLPPRPAPADEDWVCLLKSSPQ